MLPAAAAVAAVLVLALVLVRGASGAGPFEVVQGQETMDIASGRSQDVAVAGPVLTNRSDQPVRITGFSLGSGADEVTFGRPQGPDVPVVLGDVLVAQGRSHLMPSYSLGWPPPLVGNEFTQFRPFTLDPGNEVQLLLRVGRLADRPVELSLLGVDYVDDGQRRTQHIPLTLRFTQAG